MSVVVIGLSHRSAQLELLERMAVGEEGLAKALHDLCTRPHVSEAVVLSTCNRTEVYVVAERFHGAFQDVRNFYAELSSLVERTLAGEFATPNDIKRAITDWQPDYMRV